MKVQIDGCIVKVGACQWQELHLSELNLVSCSGVTPAHVFAIAAWCMMLVHAVY
jgi:hypothetical protein